MEEAQARRLQPHYIESFFLEAFRRSAAGSAAASRAASRSRTCPAVRDRDRVIGIGGPVLPRYERVTFERERVRAHGMPLAQLIAPATRCSTRSSTSPSSGTTRTSSMARSSSTPTTHGETPRLLVALIEEITNGRQPPLTVSKRFDFVELQPDTRPAMPGPHRTSTTTRFLKGPSRSST